jgi:hypothetical protein
MMVMMTAITPSVKVPNRSVVVLGSRIGVLPV